MHDEPTIREAGPDDLDALLDLYRHLQPHDVRPPEVELRRVWDEMCGTPGVRSLLLEQNGKLLASCVLVIVPNLTCGARPYALIENVVTRADHRRRGHAGTLLRHALDTARSANCYKVMLMSNKKRLGAHQLYEKLGFDRDTRYGFVTAL